MSEILSRLSLYFSYPFVWYALIVGVLISLCGAVFGVILVLKRYSFIGDGLSHVAFGAMAIAAVLRMTSDLLLVMPITVLCAILLLRTGQKGRLKGDAMIAVVSVGALGLGYLVMDIGSASANVAGDVCSTLFGSFSIITLARYEVVLCVVLAVIVIALFVLLYNRIFTVTFDEDFARACGVRTSLYNLLVAVITAVIIVLAMNLVGSLLISALLIFPALSAMRVARTFKTVVITSAVISTVCAVLGILAAILMSTPVGPTVVAADLVAFLICYAIGKIKRG